MLVNQQWGDREVDPWVSLDCQPYHRGVRGQVRPLKTRWKHIEGDT